MEPGCLALTLTWDGKQIVAAEVVSTRPAVARALSGLPAARVLELIPRLFGLCPRAQEAAARLSLAAARGEQVASSAAAPALAVALEAIGEHLWRLLLDWPPLAGQPARPSEFLGWRQRLKRVADQAEAAALGGELAAWLGSERSPALDDDAAVAAGVLLPMLSAAEWSAHIGAESFAELPTFAGQPAETGVLARRAGDATVAELLATGHRLQARLVARYADLRWLAQGLADRQRLVTWLDSTTLGDGCGLACVETARGTLLHQIQLDGDRIGRYVIVAPTEWNFHPQGSFVREIDARPAATRAKAVMAARRLVLSLDPCVACELRIRDA